MSAICESQDKEAFLAKEIDEKIDYFRIESNKHKRTHRNLRYSAFAFTAVLSALSGMAIYFQNFSTIFNICILVISALAGLFSSIEDVRKADELWIHERNALYALIDLKREMVYQLKSNENKEALLDKVFIELQYILKQSKDKWTSSIVSKQNED